MSDFPRTLFVETTTRCNLACPMCVKNQPGWQGGEGHMDLALFQRLAPDLARAEAVVLNGMGEPLTHPDLPRMVALVKACQPREGWCGLQTNGLLLTPEIAEGLASAGLDVVCFSVDGDACGPGAGHGHGPGQEDVAARGCALLRQAATAQGRTLRLGAEVVLMRGNAFQLPTLVDWASATGLDFLLVTHLLPATTGQEPEALFHPCSGAALRLFSAWRSEAEARGLDLADLTRAAMRFRRGPEEDALVDLARRMHQQAHEQGLWLNLGRLARTDYARLAELEALFAQARQRAAASGLDLRLPALSAPDSARDRRCAFIEADAAFLDWQGNAAPCHFLWHGYECRIYGEPKRVHPAHLGNIAATPLAELWNGPAWAAFRQRARAGEYPACGDCDMGMCSDACGAAGPFEQDCLGESVPCGHCPWAVGQLMCLGSETGR